MGLGKLFDDVVVAEGSTSKKSGVRMTENPPWNIGERRLRKLPPRDLTGEDSLLCRVPSVSQFVPRMRQIIELESLRIPGRKADLQVQGKHRGDA